MIKDQYMIRIIRSAIQDLRIAGLEGCLMQIGKTGAFTTKIKDKKGKDYVIVDFETPINHNREEFNEYSQVIYYEMMFAECNDIEY